MGFPLLISWPSASCCCCSSHSSFLFTLAVARILDRHRTWVFRRLRLFCSLSCSRSRDNTEQMAVAGVYFSSLSPRVPSRTLSPQGEQLHFGAGRGAGLDVWARWAGRLAGCWLGSGNAQYNIAGRQKEEELPEGLAVVWRWWAVRPTRKMTQSSAQHSMEEGSDRQPEIPCSGR